MIKTPQLDWSKTAPFTLNTWRRNTWRPMLLISARDEIDTPRPYICLSREYR